MTALGSRLDRANNHPSPDGGPPKGIPKRVWGAISGLAVLATLVTTAPQIERFCERLLGLGTGAHSLASPGLTDEKPPAIAVWPDPAHALAGTEDVFWSASGDTHLRWVVTNGGEQTARSVPGVNNVASAAAAVVDPTLNQEDVYWTGTDNQLWQDVRTSWTDKWSGPHDLEMGSLGSAPSVAVWPSVTRNTPGQEDLFWKGSGDSRLWEAVMNDGWQAPRAVPGVTNVASAPAAAVDAARNQEDIYWVGTDGHLWQQAWAGKWSGPEDLGMGSLGSAPSVAVWPSGTRATPGQQDVFWKGSGDSRLWEAVMNTNWQGPQSVPGVTNVASAPAAVVNAASGREDVYWIGTDGRVWNAVWAGKWSGPYRLGAGGSHTVVSHRHKP
jgi:hypothetical protein